MVVGQRLGYDHGLLEQRPKPAIGSFCRVLCIFGIESPAGAETQDR